MDELWGEISKILLFVKAANEAYINIHVYLQIWHLPRPTGLIGRSDRLDRSGMYSLSRIRFFIKSPHVILLVKGYVFSGL